MYPQIKRNAIECTHCHIVIESTHRHDFRVHECKEAGEVSRTYNHETKAYEDAYPWIAVDGGLEYVRVLGEPGDFIMRTEYEHLV